MIYSLVLAISLAIDAFAVAFSLGASSVVVRRIDKFKVAVSFAAFQMIMPIIGFVIVLPLSNYGIIVKLVAMGFLLFLGIKMIKESFEIMPNRCKNLICLDDECNELICKRSGKCRKLSIKDLLVYSIATSVDALLAGAIIIAMDLNIVITIIFIGVVTFILSYIGSSFTKFFKKGLEKKLELLGGVVLILLALKTLIDIF